jgi:hypothetical protein
MIHQVLIMIDSGVSLFVHSFTEIKTDPQLFSGFAMAMNNIAAELMIRRQKIELVKMTEYNIIISPFNHFFLSMVVNKYDNVDSFASIIIELENIFLEMFGNYDISGLVNLNFFDEFHNVVDRLCKSQANLVLLSYQSPAKNDIWNLLHIHDNPSESDEKNEWNVHEMNFQEIPNCKSTIWNVDLEQGIENILGKLENKNLLFIVIEPRLDLIKKIIPKLTTIRKNYPTYSIYGIFLKQYGTILKQYCEIILNLKCIDIEPSDPLAGILLLDFVLQTIKGI